MIAMYMCTTDFALLINGKYFLRIISVSFTACDIIGSVQVNFSIGVNPNYFGPTRLD